MLLEDKEEPKVIIESVDVMMKKKAYAWYNRETSTIHILNKDDLFNLVLEHEKEHHRRRNLLLTKISENLNYPSNKLLFIFSLLLCLPFIVGGITRDLLLAVLSSLPIVSIIIMSLVLDEESKVWGIVSKRWRQNEKTCNQQ